MRDAMPTPLTKWWHSLLFAIGVTAVGLTFRIQAMVSTQTLSIFFLLLLITFYQVTPIALIVAIERLLAWRRARLRAWLIVRSLFLGVPALALIAFWEDFVPLSLPSRLTPWLRFGPTVALIVFLLFLTVTRLPIPRLVVKGHSLIIQYFIVIGIIAIGWSGYIWERAATAYRPIPQASPSIQPGSSGPVIVLLFDELGRDAILNSGHINPETFPNFARLAREGSVFTNATSNSWGTGNSISTMMNGRPIYNSDECYRRLSACEDDLLSIATRNGVTVHIYSGPSFFICRPRIQCHGAEYALVRRPVQYLARQLGMFTYLYSSKLRIVTSLSSKMSWTYHWDTLSIYKGLLADIGRDTPPRSLFFVHILVPHPPLVFNSDGSRHQPADAEGADAVIRAYAHQVGYADTLLGELFDRLEEEGILDQTTIVITGDHGPRPLELLASPNPSQELTGLAPDVPFIVRGPGVPIAVTDVDYQHIDFRATVLDLLSIPDDAEHFGTSAFAEQRPQRTKVFYFGTTASGEPVPYVFDPKSMTWVAQ